MKELITIQSKLKAPKGQYNSFGGYKYRSCEDILEALKPLLKETNCYLILKDELVNIGDRYYINSQAILSNEEGKVVSAEAFAREPLSKKGMDESQISGSTASYARKYALNGLFCIDDVKDSDRLNGGQNLPPEMVEERKPDKKTNTISDKQRKRMYAIQKVSGVSEEAVKTMLKDYGYESSRDVEWEKYDEICNNIEEMGKLKADNQAPASEGL